MKIISDFHDYYDGVISYGIDPNLIYIRKTECINMSNNQAAKIYPWLFYSTEYNSSEKRCILRKVDFNLKILSTSFALFFAGKVYGGWIYSEDDTSNKFIVYPNNTLETISYLARTVKFKLNTQIITKIYEEAKTNIFTIKTLFESIFKIITPEPDKNNPCVLVIPKTNQTVDIIYNPRLKDYEFYRIIDSYSAHQALSMFIGGVLAQKENEIIKIADKDLLKAKGFDERSFRKDPTKRKI